MTSNSLTRPLDVVWSVNGFRNFVPDIQAVLDEKLAIPCKVRIPEHDDNGLVLSSLEGCDVLLVGCMKVSKPILEAGELGGNLKLVFLPAAGTDVIDFPAFKKHNESRKDPLPLVYCPGNNSRSVAEFVVMMILSSLRKLSNVVADLATGRVGNIKLGFPAGKSLYSQKIGLIGCGSIGSIVKEMLEKGFGCEVHVYRSNSSYEELQGFLSSCDVVSLHLPLNKSTKGMLGETELKWMKPGSVLVNTSRAAIVEEDSLYKLLKDPNSGPGFYAADVFWREPLSESDQMLKEFTTLPNFMLTPHNASNTDSVRKHVGERLAKAIQNVFIHNTPENLKDRLV